MGKLENVFMVIRNSIFEFPTDFPSCIYRCPAHHLHLHPLRLTCLYSRYAGHAAVAGVSQSYYFYTVCATTKQRGQGAVSLAGAAGGCEISRLSMHIESLPAQSLIPTHKSNASVTGVLVLHVCRGTGCCVREDRFSS